MSNNREPLPAAKELSSASELMLIQLSVLIISFSPLISNNLRGGGLLLLTLYLLLGVFRRKKRTFKVMLLVIVVLFMLNSMMLDTVEWLINGMLKPSYLFIPLCFIFGFILSMKVSQQNYCIKIEKILFAIALLSIFGYMVSVYVPYVVENLPSYSFYDFGGKTAVIFNVLISSEGKVIPRSLGVCSEPGMLQLLLNLGLVIYLRSGGDKLSRVVVYIISILLTVSTTGLLILAAILFTEIRKREYALHLTCLILLVFIFGVDFIQMQLESKLVGSSSFEGRLEPMLNAFYYSNEYIFGLGAVRYGELLNVYNIGAWDSYGQIVVRYGYPLLGLIILFLFIIATSYRSVALVIGATFFSQSIWFFPFITPFYFWSLEKVRF